VNADTIKLFVHGGEKLEQSIRGLTADDLLAVPIAGKWSIQQVIIHLADAEMANADRIKRVIATDAPTLLAWDQNQFMAALAYDEQSAEDAVATVKLIRRQLGRVLAKLPATAWERSGQHTERGTMTLAKLVEMGNWHLDHHLTFINEKREKLGKLMW
jgi:uncharacterized damage-inducible protein DinB